MNKWIGKDLKYNWHPYTQMKDAQSLPPLLIQRAFGFKLFDRKGNFYYDTISSWWCNVHGHNHPRIINAALKQMRRLDHVLFAGFTHKPAIQLAEKLVSIAMKGLTRVFFSDNGSTAVETALKISFQYWQNSGKKNKTKFICLDLGYHGDTVGAMSVAGKSLFNEIFRPLMFASFKAPTPYCYRCPMAQERKNCHIECLKPLEKLLAARHNEIAAMILEPLVMGSAGMIVYPEEYLQGARKLTKKYNVHLIADEVATAFGRTGKMFACEHAGISPDLLCLSKGLTSGFLPLAATLTTENIYRAFYADFAKRKTFYHGHTYTANPISCSCALASLELFEEEKTLERVKRIMPLLHAGMEEFRDLAIVGDVRYKGMIAALELVRDKRNKSGFGFKRRIGMDIFRAGLKRHLILRPLGDVIYLFLPLCVKKQELEYVLDNTFKIIKSAGKNEGLA